MAELPSPARGGPWIYAAILCEAITRNAQGQTSISGITNHVRLRAGVSGEGTPAFNIKAQLTMALCITPGDALGTAHVRVTIDRPDGTTDDGPTMDVEFRGPDQSELSSIVIAIDFHHVGLHWFNVLVDGVLLTRVPFRIDLEVVRRQSKTPQDRRN